MSPYGLDDADWRRLLSIASVWRACAPQLSRLHALGGRDGVRGALAKLGLIAQDAGREAASDGDAVSIAVARWCDEIDRTLASRSVPSDEREVLEDMRGFARGASATDPFRELFERVEKKAATVYDDGWPGAELVVEKMMRHPRAGDDPYAVTAVTGEARPNVVALRIHPPGLGPATWAALPSLVVHECVCHVPARQRGLVDNASAFAEGFMHWAAMFFFERWSACIDPALAPAARTHAGPFWEVVSRPSLEPGAARHVGMGAAERLLVYAQADLGLPYDAARPAVASLALRLNLTDAPLALKDNLVVRLAASRWSAELYRCVGATLKLGMAPAELLKCVCNEIRQR